MSCTRCWRVCLSTCWYSLSFCTSSSSSLKWQHNIETLSHKLASIMNKLYSAKITFHSPLEGVAQAYFVYCLYLTVLNRMTWVFLKESWCVPAGFLFETSKLGSQRVLWPLSLMGYDWTEGADSRREGLIFLRRTCNWSKVPIILFIYFICVLICTFTFRRRPEMCLQL